MRMRLAVGAASAVAFVVGFIGFGGGAASPHALGCPQALAAACDPVNAALLTACYSDLPSVPTVGPVTVQVDRRLPVYCPDFLVSR